MTSFVIAHIASAYGGMKLAEARGIPAQETELSDHYRQFDRFGVNDILARLATDAEGDLQQYAIVAIVYQDIMSEKNDDLIIETFARHRPMTTHWAIYFSP